MLISKILTSFCLLQVALSLGLSGALRREELCNMTINNIVDHGDELVMITIPQTKTNVSKSFVVADYLHKIFQKYRVLRPAKCTTERFFLNYQDGKCTNQPIGINKFGKMPKQIAEFLRLPNPESYTGHAFRRTSATLLAEAGADITTLKRHGKWKSDAIAESYVEQSVTNKVKINRQIMQTISLNPPSASKETSAVRQNNSDVKPTEVPLKKTKMSEENNFQSRSKNSVSLDNKPSTSTESREKENSFSLSALGQSDKKYSIHVSNCSVSFNFSDN